MSDISNIGGPDRTGQGGGSGNYYVPMRARQQIKTEAQKLKVGEIVLGTVMEIVSNEIAKVKLPMGTFTAVLHKRLCPGDTLFLLVAEIEPQLVLKVHSVSTTQAGRLRASPEIARILDLPEKQLIIDIIEYLSKKKSTILRSEIINFSSILDKLNFNEKNHSKEAFFNSIFTFTITLNKDIDLVVKFYDVFLPLNEMFQKLSDALYKFELFKAYHIQSNTPEIQANPIFLEIIRKTEEYNKFAQSNSLPIFLIFLAKNSYENMMFRIEIFTEMPAIGIKPNISPIIESFTNNFCNTIDQFLKLNNAYQIICSEKEKIIDTLDRLLIKSNSAITHFSVFSDKNGIQILKEGLLRALPRNFTVVI